ncbi:sulfonate transport system permease protein [Verrucomicrobium sp. GAS474]|uniref:ABC transporter permease subunit n=1 Tax=Verrucomicrobium sp. GAS474 TaxID=1882831 RepID=UPI00087AB585|nr:ABC transporter permease subunit [Verrucomicrobium sp. GAS474]SDT93579.1 sulfonate transport system permease protein [Verrucomicrobium sp. GAS474]
MHQPLHPSPAAAPGRLRPAWPAWLRSREGRQWFVPALLLVAWDLGFRFGLFHTNLFPTPEGVVNAVVRLWQNGELVRDLTISTERALAGFALGGAIGFGLGLLNGLFRVGEELLDTTIQMVRNVPHLALMPLVILWFGIGESTKVFLVALGVFFPIYLNTFHGIRSIDPDLVQMGRIYGLTRWQLFRHIIFPGALPSILNGIRFSLGLMWLTLIVAETVASSSGIGYMSMNAREFLQTDVILLGILLYALLGKIADSLVRLLERRLLRWHPTQAKLSAQPKTA